MVSLNRRWLGGFAAAVMLFPGGVRAQTTAPSFDQLQGILKAESLSVSSAQAASQGATGKAMTRGRWMAIGAGVGGGAGVVVGEYYFGRKLDMAHGPDMLVGAGVGAGVGALIAWAMTALK